MYRMYSKLEGFRRLLYFIEQRLYQQASAVLSVLYVCIGLCFYASRQRCINKFDMLSSEKLYSKLEWFSFLRFSRTYTHCCRSGVYKKSATSANFATSHARQSFHFQRSIGTLKLNIFSKLHITSFTAMNICRKENLKLKLFKHFVFCLQIWLNDFWFEQCKP